MMRSRVNVLRALRLGAVAAGVAAALAAGCGDPRGESSTPGSGPTPPDDLGSISVELHLGATIRLSSVAYHISRPGFDKTGNLDVSNSATVTGLVGGIPAATGYSLAMTATDTAGLLTGCQGTASAFDVTAGAVTPVAVHLTCHETPATPPPPPPPPAVPIPPVVPAVLALALLVLGLRKSVTRLRKGTR
jgi:hypothetical protein